MKKISLIFILILMAFTTIKAQDKGAYLNFGGGLGVTGFNYDLTGISEDGKNQWQLGGNGIIGFSYFFTPHWGFNTGIGLSYYRTKGKYENSMQRNNYYTLGQYTDDDAQGNPRTFDLRTRLANWEEKQSGYFLEIPLMLMYQFKFGEVKKHGMYFGLGVKFQIPVHTNYEVVDAKYADDARLNVSGYYAAPNLELGAPGDPDLSQHGFGSIHNPHERYGWDGKMEIKPSIAGTAELGFLIGLNRRWDLTIGGYLDYGFNDIKKQDKELMEGPTQYHVAANENVAQGIEYNGMVNSNVTDRVNLISAGVKIGLRVKLGKIEEPPVEEVAVVIPVCDTVFDTVVVKEIVEIIVEKAPEKQEFTQEEKDLLKARIFFDLNRAELKPEAKRTLNEVAAFMQRHPGIHIRILGNTCDLGNERINVPLGLRRAESAKKYLVNIMGISSQRLSTSTVSSHEPLLPNVDELNRQLNRRCEFEIDQNRSTY